MNIDEIRSIVALIGYKGWRFEVMEEANIVFLQAVFCFPCSCRDEKQIMEHRCRKWRISPRTTRSELVQTAFKAVLTAEEHEIREQFLYKGCAVFSPHFDVEQLAELYSQRLWDMRINSYVVDEAN